MNEAIPPSVGSSKGSVWPMLLVILLVIAAAIVYVMNKQTGYLMHTKPAVMPPPPPPVAAMPMEKDTAIASLEQLGPSHAPEAIDQEIEATNLAALDEEFSALTQELK